MTNSIQPAYDIWELSFQRRAGRNKNGSIRPVDCPGWLVMEPTRSQQPHTLGTNEALHQLSHEVMIENKQHITWKLMSQGYLFGDSLMGWRIL